MATYTIMNVSGSVYEPHLSSNRAYDLACELSTSRNERIDVCNDETDEVEAVLPPGQMVEPGTVHEAAVCVRLMGVHLRYSKSWSDAFECPVCRQRKRYNLNFLGGRDVVCTGVKVEKLRA